MFVKTLKHVLLREVTKRKLKLDEFARPLEYVSRVTLTLVIVID